MTDERVLHGGCLCGAVRFEARGAPENVRICHCRLCQRAMAGPFFARALYRTDQVTLTGPAARFASSDELWRVFCPTCGSTVAGVRADGGHVSLALAAFDDQTALAPECHFWTSSKAPWTTLGDGLPQYPEWAPD